MYFNLFLYYAVQSQDLGICGTENEINPAQSPRTLTLYQSSTWLNEYRTPGYWIPNSTNTPLKTIRVNWIICRKSDGTGGWQDTQAFRDQVALMFTKLNETYSNSLPMGYQLTCPPTMTHVVDSRIRWELNEIIFIDNDAFNNTISGTPVMEWLATNHPTALNCLNHIFTMPSSPPSYWGYYTVHNNNAYVLTMKSMFSPYLVVWDDHVGHVVHEYGHAVGLGHPYDSEYREVSHYDFMDDIFGTCAQAGYCNPVPAPGYVCWFQKNFWESQPREYPIMVSAPTIPLPRYINPKSMGRMHRALSHYDFYFHINNKPMHKYVKEDHSFSVPKTITLNEIWDFDIKMYQDIIVESGATLTITGEVRMPIGGKIIVKPGGKLNIEGGKVTSAHQEPWQGIEVWGNESQHQFTYGNNQYYQGYVNLDHAIIEHAICAVNLWKPNDYTSTGGIVIAKDCQFVNNTQSLHALHYKNFHPITGAEMDNISIFRNCVFELNSDYFGTVEFFKHIDLSYLKGIKFYGCDFTLSSGASNINWYNHGIAAYSAGFHVGPICLSQIEPCNSYDKSTFTGLRTGITVRNLNSTYTFTVKHSIFNNLVYGIDNYSANNATILNNTFSIGSDYFGDNCAFGIYQRLATGFAIENDILDLNPNSKCVDHFGIHTMNTNGIDEIYRNQFKNLKYANFAAGENRDPSAIATGLQYFCNYNNENYADFYIQSNPSSFISFFQGNLNLPTGNTFSSNGVMHIYNGNPNGYIAYYYNEQNPAEIPDPTKVFGNVALAPIRINNPCLDHYGDIIKEEKLTEVEKTETELRYAVALSNLQNVTTLYNSLIDGGSTDEKLIEISSATPNDAWEIRASLLGNSPHLSETVLKAMSDRTDVLSESTIFEILSANPDELRNEDLMVYLEEKANPLPEYMMNLLRQLSTGLSYRTSLEGEIALYDRERIRASHDMLRSLLNEEQTDYVSVRAWLDNLSGLSSDRQIISTYVQENNYTDAIALANLLPTLYNFSEDELQLHADYMYLLNLQQNLYNEGRVLSQLSESEISNVNAISLTNEDLAGSQAKGIMQAIYGDWIGNCPDVNDTVTWKSARIDDRLLAKAIGVEISVNPNPAQTWCSYKYKLPLVESTAEVKIFDSKNMLIHSFTINGKQGELLWDTREVNSGIYFYQFKTNNIILGGKIVVIK